MRGGGGLALVRTQAKRSSRVVTRTIVFDLGKVLLLVLFIVVIVAVALPVVRLAKLSAQLSQQNRVLEMKILELQQQIEQLENQRSLMLARHELVRTGEHEK